MRRRAVAAAVALAAALALASPASATVRQVTLRYGPIHMAPYDLKRGDITYGIPTPRADGFVTHMEANVVDGSGNPVPIQRVMLHHVVFFNSGPRLGARRDGTCGRFTLFDNQSQSADSRPALLGWARSASRGSCRRATAIRSARRTSGR